MSTTAATILVELSAITDACARDRRVPVGADDADALAVDGTDDRIVVCGEVQKDVGDLAGERPGIGDVTGRRLGRRG
ncbi:MAG TPA: hypothetical protein VFM06_04825 [Candidatus Limnocylindria bacterium]|nr:hypothetical protein [Candidatus Limnocylindria bacterium]